MKKSMPAHTTTVATLRPLSSDRVTAVALARMAILSRNDPEAETGPFLSMVERDVADGSATGVLRVDGERVNGIALWELPTELGATVQVLYLVEGTQTPERYRDFLREIAAIAGPVAFAPGRFAGLSDAEEEETMRGLGFARFARSEMRLPPESPAPEVPSVALSELRVYRPDDLSTVTRLHQRAYEGQFDRYLFLTDPDPGRNAELEMQGIVGGRWGEFLPWASWVVDGRDGVVAASLVVRAPYGPLIADVMVDPSLRGRRLGGAVVASTIRALRARGESVIVLNVTDGNRRAVRLYERLGFVRSLGPSYGWYSTARIPISPEQS
jgi:ribosomal protein S18 acetylase RimI-like enzyme